MSCYTNAIRHYCFISFLVSLLCTTGCGELTGENTGADKEFAKTKEPTDNSDNQQQSLPQKIGSLLSKQVTGGHLLSGTANNLGNSSHSYEINLQRSFKGSFVFFADKNLEDGLKIQWIERGDTYYIILTKGQKKIEHAVHLDQELPLHFILDIHNDHSDIHVFVWQKGAGFGVEPGCTFLKDGGCLLNTIDFEYDLESFDRLWSGVGNCQGRYWGIKGSPDGIDLLKGPLAANTKM